MVRIMLLLLAMVSVLRTFQFIIVIVIINKALIVFRAVVKVLVRRQTILIKTFIIVIMSSRLIAMVTMVIMYKALTFRRRAAARCDRLRERAYALPKRTGITLEQDSLESASKVR